VSFSTSQSLSVPPPSGSAPPLLYHLCFFWPRFNRTFFLVTENAVLNDTEKSGTDRKKNKFLLLILLGIFNGSRMVFNGDSWDIKQQWVLLQ
jgi:hypothetical protein